MGPDRPSQFPAACELRQSKDTVKLITLTPCLAAFMRRQINRSGIPKEVASIRFRYENDGYFFDVTGRPKGHHQFRSRGIPICVSEEQASIFENSIICWFPNDLAHAKWWIDNDEMWRGRGGASNPIGIEVSEKKIRNLRPEWFGLRSFGLQVAGLVSNHDRQQWLRYLNWNTERGDSRAAVVLQTLPLLVAAYSDDLRAAAVLRFPNWLAHRYELAVGSKLVTINNYELGETRASDLPPVQDASTRLTNYRPLIAEFVSDEMETIERRRRAIGDDEFELARRLGEVYLRHNQYLCRQGIPFLSGSCSNLVSSRYS